MATALKESEQRYQAIFENSKKTILVVDDEELVLNLVTRRLCIAQTL